MGKEVVILASVGAVVADSPINARESFIKKFVSTLREVDVSLTPYTILGYVHEIDKEINMNLWSRVLSNSTTARSKGVYTEFDFKEGNIVSKAHYITGQKYAKELTSSNTRYTGRLISIEEDGIYLNHKKVEVL